MNSDSDESRRAATLTRFINDIDTAVLPAFEAVRALPGYRELAESDARELLRSIRWVFATIAESVRQERDLTVREIERLHAIGVARARWGVPYAAFQQAFAVGFDHAIATLRAVARDLGDDGRVADTIVRDLVSRLADAVSAREDGFASMSGTTTAPETVEKVTFVESVLEGGTEDPRLERMASGLGFATSSARALFLAVPRSGTETDLHALVEDAIESLGPKAAGGVRRRPSPHAVVLRSGRVDDGVKGVLTRHAAIHHVAWTALTAERWGAVGAQYRRLRPFVHVVAAVGPALVDLDQLAAYEPLAYTPMAVAHALCARYLGPVFALPARDARLWLRIFQELHRADWIVADGAKRLGMHPNTLYRRLEGFAEQTGIDCRTSQGRLLVLQALHLWHLFGEAMPAPGDASWS